MRVRGTIPVVSLCALSIGLVAGSTLWAQAAPPPPADTTRHDSSRELSIAVGKTAVIDFTQRVTRVAVGLGDVAEASVVSPTEILVDGKAPGATSLIVWEDGGVRQFFNVTVHQSMFNAEGNLTDLRRQLRMALPGQNVEVSYDNGLVVLRGTVSDLNGSDRAVQLASTGGNKVVNLLYVNVPQSPPQILLKVHFCSVDRNLAKSLGLNIFSLGAANSIGQVSTGQFSPVAVTDTGTPLASIGNGLNLQIFRPDINLGATIQALETKGVVEELAEPNLLAQDGKEASFMAGGEYPYPIVQGIAAGSSGAVTIQFKQYGIRLSFIPTITPRDTIRLQLAPEVSSLDFTHSIELSGFNVPGINIRRVKTEVELANGQSFVIGGLLDNSETQTFEKIPFIGDVPILGKFFQSIQRTKNNTELIVIVTPEIVPPIPVGQPIPALNYPVKFMPPNSHIPMSNPSATAGTAAPQPESVPVEQLIESNKPEKPLTSDTGSFSAGGGGGGI